MLKMIARKIATILFFAVAFMPVFPIFAQANEVVLAQDKVQTIAQAQTQSTTSAQSQISAPAQITNTDGIRLELVQSTQHPESKAISFTINITSQVTSDRAQLRWEIIGPAEIISGDKTQTINLKANQTYSYSIGLIPRGSNRVELRAVLEAFQIDGTRQATASQTLVFQPNGEILFPQAGQHQLMKTILVVRNIAGTVLLILLGGIVIFRGGRFLYFWLNN